MRHALCREPRDGSTAETSISLNCLPAGIALRHIRAIAGRIGAIVPTLRGVGLAIVIIAIVWPVIPPIGIRERSPEEEPVIAKSIAAKPAILKSAPVETSAPTPAMSGIGEFWLAERRRAQQRR